MADEFGPLLACANKKGVLLHGIEPIRVPGCGIGMRAKSRVKEGQEVMMVPMRSTRNLTSIPKALSTNLPGDASIHCMLALDITMDQSPELDLWRGALPSLRDVEASMPFMWDDELQRLLPRSAQDILRRQRVRFAKDWAMVSAAFPNVKQQDYLYSWFMINSRTFYHEADGIEKYPEDDRLALLPLADLFNHAVLGCKVSFSSDGYSITADRAYRPGEDMYISYGDHPDDYLLVEYGFVPDENRWDRISLHDVLMQHLSATESKELSVAGCSGPFTLTPSSSSTSDATIAAMRIIHHFKEGAQDTKEGAQDTKEGAQDTQDAKIPPGQWGPIAETDALKRLATALVAQSEQRLTGIAVFASHRGQNGPCETLNRRWTKIRDVGVEWINSLASESTPSMG